jgi:hypothetical protein
MKNLHVAWTKHIKDPEAKAKFEQLLRNSGISLGRLRNIIREKIGSLNASERNPKVYEAPNWPYMQSHNNGFMQGLQYVDDLLKFLDDKDK